MKLDSKIYDGMVKQTSPPSKIVKNCSWAFFVGGGICLLGELLKNLYFSLGFTLTDASTLTSSTLVLISALLTATGLYHKIAVKAGAGTLVPITGFANAIVSPAIEYKYEGLVTGTGSKMFVVAGPVIVYGMVTSVAWGVLWYFIRIFIN